MMSTFLIAGSPFWLSRNVVFTKLYVVGGLNIPAKKIKLPSSPLSFRKGGMLQKGDGWSFSSPHPSSSSFHLPAFYYPLSSPAELLFFSCPAFRAQITGSETHFLWGYNPVEVRITLWMLNGNRWLKRIKKGERNMKRSVMLFVLLSLLIARGNSALAGCPGWRGRTMRSCGPYYYKPYSNFEAAVAVITAFDMIRGSINGNSPPCYQAPPPCPPIYDPPQPVYNPVPEIPANADSSNWEVDYSAPGQYFEMQ